MNNKDKLGRFKLIQLINLALVLSFSAALLVSCYDRFILADEGATIASITVNDQNDASTYVFASVNFFSGTNTEVATYGSNQDVEYRLDSFTIVED